MNISKGSALIENIKSILLVVLFLLTILLLYFFWGNTPLKNLIWESSTQYDTISPVSIFQPDRIEICFGGGSYTIIDDKFDVMMACFKTFSDSRNLSITTIEKGYYEEIMKYSSMKAVFEYYIPFGVICELYGIDRIPGSDAIDAVSELAYVADFDNCMFIYDKTASKYYIIAGGVNNCFETLRQEIGNARQDYDLYFTLETYMGGGIQNNTLCPVSFESNLYNTDCFREDFSGREGKSNDIIKNFFSDNFDFVRRIAEENGTVIYMYGYGRIVVVAHNNGILEFKREDDDWPGAQLRYLDAFERANAFIAVHGGFAAIEGTAFTPYIKQVIIDPEGKKGVRFIFGIKIGNGKVYYQSGEPIIVDVTNGMVSYFKRQLINVNLNDTKQDNGYREVFSAFNLLAINNGYIEVVLIEMKRADAEDISFEAILEKVTRFDCGYVKTDNENTLKASWVVTIDGIEFYFGLDDGKPQGYRLR